MILERYNGFIQAFLFLFVLLYDGIYKGVLNNAEETSLLIDIVGVLLIEVFILNIKDSIAQRKLNELKVSTSTLTQLVPFDPHLMDDFPALVKMATQNVFISGIICTNVLEFYESIIEELLDQGLNVRLLISSEKCIDYNAKQYFGFYESNRNSDEQIKEAKSKLNTTLRSLQKYDKLKYYYSQKRFEIRCSDSLISVGFVGIDNFSKRAELNRAIKVTHYIFGCTNTPNCPRELISSLSNKHWFDYYNDFIKEQWRNATPYLLPPY